MDNDEYVFELIGTYKDGNTKVYTNIPDMEEVFVKTEEFIPDMKSGLCTSLEFVCVQAKSGIRSSVEVEVETIIKEKEDE
jgi:hypothetical protein